jgi:phenylpropionate dioxygenase-like ring-hydroxylating dioxygenase large terminal subunit
MDDSPLPAGEGLRLRSPVARAWPDGGTSRVANWVYTDPAIFAREQERIFGADDWLYVCLEAELPNAGDFKRSQLGTRDVVAVRAADGAINVLVNRCAHRSMQFCAAARGTTKEFVCPYHQWTYDLQGNLLGVPFRRGSPISTAPMTTRSTMESSSAGLSFSPMSASTRCCRARTTSRDIPSR